MEIVIYIESIAFEWKNDTQRSLNDVKKSQELVNSIVEFRSHSVLIPVSLIHNISLTNDSMWLSTKYIDNKKLHKSLHDTGSLMLHVFYLGKAMRILNFTWSFLAPKTLY